MPMCHLILIMPLLAQPVFWLMPPAVSVPVYAVIAVVSGFVYLKVMGSMKRPPATGSEALAGLSGEVVSSAGDNRYIVRAGGELWTARGRAGLETGQRVVVSTVERLTLFIDPVNDEFGTGAGVGGGKR